VVRWKAIYAFGKVVAEIAEVEPERARIVIRRLMWMLNEESGSMPWGVPEGFAEALYNSPLLRNEYRWIFVSYIWEDSGNFLEFPPAQRGVVWGIGRLAEKFSPMLWETRAPYHLKKLLEKTSDPAVAFLGVWAFSRIKHFPEDFPYPQKLLHGILSRLLQENFSYLMFDGKEICIKTAKELAKEVNLNYI